MNSANDCFNWPELDHVPENLDQLWRDQKGWCGSDLMPADWEVWLPSSFIESATRVVKENSDPVVAALKLIQDSPGLEIQKKIESMLEGGIGFCVLKGLPAIEDSPFAEKLFLTLGSLFGRPVSQTQKGNLIARVEDLSLELATPTVRGHQTSAELAYHCDRADRILLLCVRPALSGGESSIVSSIYLYQQMREQCRELAEILEERLPQDRRGEHGPHELPFCELPVFSRSENCFVARYLRRFIHDSQRHSDAPRLKPKSYRALDALDALMELDQVPIKMSLQSGDIQVINNNVVFHARTAFHDNPAARRLLLRLWLAHRSSRPLPDSFAVLYGSVVLGALRGGVWPSVLQEHTISGRAGQHSTR